MERVAVFQTVSSTEFARTFAELFPASDEERISEAYARVQIPRRATAGSAGYDFVTPVDLMLFPGESVTVPTGIRAKMREDYVLLILPRSGLGFRYRIQLDNTAGVIDSDYYGADNEGHILIRITNDSKSGKALSLQAGKAFAQGLFLPYGITVDDEVENQRSGGFGSTG